jgi:pyruvate ferredoxin oxidoreductase beta subunit
MNLKELSKREEVFVAGHRMCPGCGAGIVARQVTLAANQPIVVASATGCLEVSSSIYPFTSWKVPWIHNAFENAAATLSGVEAAYNALKKQGKIKKDIKFIAFGGDGGTYDIGLQSLSGTLERGHNLLYVCYDNEAYMNTGIQRSSATPFGAETKTDPYGKARAAKQEFKKNLTEVVVSHGIPYIAQASVGYWNDLNMKVEKALNVKGPSFINVLSPCIPGWGVPANTTIKIAKLATETNFWPLYEVENGKYTINYDPEDRKKQMIEWIKLQKRFSHLMEPANKPIIDKIQAKVDSDWELLKKKTQL